MVDVAAWIDRRDETWAGRTVDAREVPAAAVMILRSPRSNNGFGDCPVPVDASAGLRTALVAIAGRVGQRPVEALMASGRES
jgi:hypothetical protein